MSRRILLIETDSNQVTPFVTILTYLGYSVFSCTGSDAFESVTMNEPDLIFIINGSDDLGSNICIQLKASPFTGRVPIILTSISFGLQQQAVECGADSYLSIPFDMNFMVVVMKRLLEDNYGY